jgi:hypothetical protein
VNAATNSIDKRLYSDAPLKRPGEGRGDTPPRLSADGKRRHTVEFSTVELNQPLENLEARQVMRKEVYGPHDALDLLYKAATDKSVTARDSILPRHTDSKLYNAVPHISLPILPSEITHRPASIPSAANRPARISSRRTMIEAIVAQLPVVMARLWIILSILSSSNEILQPIPDMPRL